MNISKYVLTIGLLTLVSGVAVGAWWWLSPAQAVLPAPVARVPDSTSEKLDLAQLQLEIVNLKKALEDEMLARRHLEETVAQLGKSAIATPHKTYTTETARDAVATVRENAVQNDQKTAFENALIAIGVTAPRITDLRQRIEQMELQQIYLRNQAQREGWLGTSRYNEERRKLEDRDGVVRAEIGDESYDKYLYLSGEENRVAVQSVLAGSAAQAAGIQDGDIIFRYDHRRIFRWSDLTNLTATGRMGENVAVDVVRAGQPMTVYVPRGPLGVRLAPQLEKPV